MLDTKNVCKVSEINEFPMPEEFISKQNEKENIEDVC